MAHSECGCTSDVQILGATSISALLASETIMWSMFLKVKDVQDCWESLLEACNLV
jgi:hypothetical protein